MKWILMIYFGAAMKGGGQSGFSTEFDDLPSCQAAYNEYLKRIPKPAPSKVAGFCMRKGMGK